MTRFEQLLERHEQEIYTFLRRMTPDREDAADVLQETFLKAFRAFPKLPADANHRAWLYRIASRTAINLARSKKHRATLPLHDVPPLPERDGDLDSLVETRRLAGSLEKMVQGLPARQRVALLQRKYHGLSYAEIGEILGCSEGTARAHVYQAMAKVRRCIGGIDPAPARVKAGRA